MEPTRLTLESLEVQSFATEPAIRARPGGIVISEPSGGYETDDARQSLCFVSCAGSCGGECCTV